MLFMSVFSMILSLPVINIYQTKGFQEGSWIKLKTLKKQLSSLNVMHALPKHADTTNEEFLFVRVTCGVLRR